MTDPQAQPILDMQRLFVGIRRRRRFWLALGLAGLIAGAALAVLRPAPPTATARLLIIHEQDSPSDGGTLMKTDIAVLETTRIGGAALKSVKSAETPVNFLKDYTGTGLTNNVMELTVKGSSDADAVAKTKPLADTFIADYVHRLQAGVQAQVQALNTQREQAQTELNQVDDQINALSGKNSPNAATQLEALYGHRADLSSRITDLTSTAQQAGIGSPKVTDGTQIVDEPQPVKNSLLKTGGTNAGIGLAAGLAIGIAFAAITGVVRDRPVLRRELSAHLGASVIAQLRSRRVKERKRVAATLVRLIRDGPGTVSLLYLGCQTAVTALAGDIAEELGVAIKFGSVHPGAAWTDLQHLGSETVLAVRAGYANTLWLHTVARQLADCRIPIIGVVVVDPDPRDKTDGTLWDGLHTALRGRSRHAPPPPHNGHTTSTSLSHNGHTANGEASTRRLAPIKPEVF